MHPKSKKQYFVGVDVGGSSIKFGVFECKAFRGKHLQNPYDLRLVDKFSIPTMIHKKDNEKCLLNDIFIAIENYFVQVNGWMVFDITNKKMIVGIGFSVPGPVVNNKLIHAVNINWKKKCDIVKATKKRFGKNIKVAVMNDANAAALAEYKLTLKEKCNSMCLITLGTGVGTGVIIDGKLVEGRSGIGGELAHIRLDYSKDAIKCNCGNVGCIETVSSCVGLANVYKRLKKNAANGKPQTSEKKLIDDDIATVIETSKDGKLGDLITAKEIIDGAKNGDKISYSALDISLDYISRLIAILMHVYEPEVVLIGGGMSNAGTFITNIIEKHLKEKVYMTKVFPKIMIAKLKNKAGIYGAIANM